MVGRLTQGRPNLLGGLAGNGLCALLFGQFFALRIQHQRNMTINGGRYAQCLLEHDLSCRVV